MALGHQEDMVVQRTIFDTGRVVEAHASPYVADAHMELDQASLAEAYSGVAVVEEAHHSCKVAVVGAVPLASAAVGPRSTAVRVAQEVLAACTAASYRTSWPRDLEGPEAADLSLSGSCHLAALHRRCWRRQRRAGRKRPGQTGDLRGHNLDPAGPGIAPCCVSLAVGLFYCCFGTDSARHPALPTGHRPLCSLGVDSEPVSLSISRRARGKGSWDSLPDEETRAIYPGGDGEQCDASRISGGRVGGGERELGGVVRQVAPLRDAVLLGIIRVFPRLALFQKTRAVPRSSNGSSMTTPSVPGGEKGETMMRRRQKAMSVESNHSCRCPALMSGGLHPGEFR